jgi:glycosyltransferase involved in cell wall biosynthesis
MELPDWPLVSALFITYNRFDLLEQAVHGFRQNTDYPNLEIVISDNGSDADVQARIRKLPANVFAMLPKNRGLGANNNNGIRNCRGKYVLMIQDDWLCHGPSDYLSNAVAVMEANPDLGLINFAGAPHPPDIGRPLKGSAEPCYVTPTPLPNHKEEFLYCDQPHLQRRAALDLIGPYFEDREVGLSEYDYCERWKRQTRFLTAVFPGYHMRVFSDEGLAQGRSYRLSSFRSRVDGALLPAARFLKENCKPLYRAGKASIRASVGLMEKIGIVR